MHLFFFLNVHDLDQRDFSALTENLSVVDSSVDAEETHHTELTGLEHNTDDCETNPVSSSMSGQQKKTFSD